MDVDRFINLRVDKDNDQDNWRASNRAQGARMSAMEHLVPEQMFSREEARANGISAVKAIQLAAAESQKIYTITHANLSIAMQQIQLSSEIKAGIRNAVSAGMEVTTHQEPVNFFGSQSVGYILLDPNTGAGACRIGGRENGSDTAALAGNIMAFGVAEKVIGLLGFLSQHLKPYMARASGALGIIVILHDATMLIVDCLNADKPENIHMILAFALFSLLAVITAMLIGGLILGWIIASYISIGLRWFFEQFNEVQDCRPRL